MTTSTRNRTHVRRIVCKSTDVRETMRRIRRNGGRVVLSAPIGIDSYAVDYVTGV